ncbi:MAG: hypothetical protein KTR20_07570 [Cellvibrionaceae bacterium]|nr:hypothetical protein [Cellvibrionaceae bacterium]
MMRSLAEFIMRGRLQAAVLALLGIPLLTPATIGLVTLRHGAREGAIMLLIAICPVLLGVILGRPVGLLFWVNLLSLGIVYLPALLLRATSSWSFTLVSTTLLISVAVPFASLQFDIVSQMLDLIGQWLLLLAQEQATQEQAAHKHLMSSPILVSGMLGLSVLFYGVTALLLARWWQALLFNPGGFGQEFRALRLGLTPSLICFIAAGFCFSRGAEYSFWMSVLAMPLVMVGIAIVHSVVKGRQLHRTWLVIFYLLMVFFSPALIVLAVMGFIDVHLDIRRRLALTT